VSVATLGNLTKNTQPKPDLARPAHFGFSSSKIYCTVYR
jgi:hypothetical protein